MKNCSVIFCIAALASLIFSNKSLASCPEAQWLKRSDLESSDLEGSSMELHSRIGDTVEAYLRAFNIPGAVVLVGHAYGTSFHRAYGTFDGETPLERDAVFDLASITKLFTATALLKEMEQRRISPNAKMGKLLPAYRRAETKDLSISQLMRHESGLRPGLSSDHFASGLEQTWKNILSIDPEYPRGEFKYSDVNYMVLGKALEELRGQNLGLAIRELVLGPLGMENSGFLPGQQVDCHERCVPTSREVEKGVVHDPSSRKLGSVAGHAGMFATALDLSKFASMFLSRGNYCGTQVLSNRQVEMMTKKKKGSHRGLGFDISSRYSEWPRGDYFAKGLSYGHTGFTGVSMWIDPTIDTYLIVLSNPVFAKNWKDAKEGLRAMVKDLADLVGKAHSL